MSLFPTPVNSQLFQKTYFKILAWKLLRIKFMINVGTAKISMSYRITITRKFLIIEKCQILNWSQLFEF